MKKIMFNDKYGLTDAVLQGRKTMTRREVPIDIYNATDWKAFKEGDIKCYCTFEGDFVDIRLLAKYRRGEVVAVAQRYSDLAWDTRLYKEIKSLCPGVLPWHELKGWDNKMFVKADLMPHQIRITDIKVERMQDISEEDCLKEGIQEYFPYIDRDPNDKVRTFRYFKDGKICHCISPASKCFAYLIDDISGKGTWEQNPYVFAYTFELVK